MVDLKIIDEKNTDTSAFDSGSRPQFNPLGKSGTEVFAGYFTEEYLQKLRGRSGAKIYDEMRRSETQVAMLLSAVMNPIKSAMHEFEAANITDGEKHKEFIAYNAKTCIDWEAHLHEALTMLVYGFSLFEVVHSVVINDARFGTFNGLKSLAYRNQKTIERWTFDPETATLKEVEQWVQGDLVTGRSSMPKMDARHLLIFTVQKEGDNYEGISALRPMYGAWYRKNLYLKIAAIGMEKSAIGTPIGTVPAGKISESDMDGFKEVLSNFTAHESSHIIVPEGFKIDIHKTDFDADKVKEMILLENTEMVNSFLANFLALGMNGGGGAFALGSDLSDFFLNGIQQYANIITGVWNRKLIPDLIKLNFGPQVEYPKLKITGINDKAGKEIAEVIKSFIDSGVIKADEKLDQYVRKQFKLPEADVATQREIQPSQPFQFSESRLKLAEGYKTTWANDKKSIKSIMQTGLTDVLKSYEKQIESKWKTTSKANRPLIAMQLEPKGLPAYNQMIKEELARISFNAIESARKETPKAARNVKLSESFKLAAPRGGYFEALPSHLKKLIQAQAALISETQVNDLAKIVLFQFNSSQGSTEDVDQVIRDVEDAAVATIQGSTSGGSSIDAAAGNAVSTSTNQARLEWFFEPEVLATIESFTFYNEDPVSEICQELDGTTFAVNDPDLDRYAPPLHHNCKSRLVPNEKGLSDNPEIKKGNVSISDKASKAITLCECDYHLGFKLAEIKD